MGNVNHLHNSIWRNDDWKIIKAAELESVYIQITGDEYLIDDQEGVSNKDIPFDSTFKQIQLIKQSQAEYETENKAQILKQNCDTSNTSTGQHQLPFKSPMKKKEIRKLPKRKRQPRKKKKDQSYTTKVRKSGKGKKKRKTQMEQHAEKNFYRAYYNNMKRILQKNKGINVKEFLDEKNAQAKNEKCKLTLIYESFKDEIFEAMGNPIEEVFRAKSKYGDKHLEEELRLVRKEKNCFQVKYGL